MKININAVNFTIEQKLIDFVEKKMEKIGRFSSKIIDSDVYLKLDNTNSKENKIVEIKVNVPGDHFLVKKEHKTFEEAVDACITPIERFLEKYKHNH